MNDPMRPVTREPIHGAAMRSAAAIPGDGISRAISVTRRAFAACLGLALLAGGAAAQDARRGVTLPPANRLAPVVAPHGMVVAQEKARSGTTSRTRACCSWSNVTNVVL